MGLINFFYLFKDMFYFYKQCIPNLFFAVSRDFFANQQQQQQQQEQPQQLQARQQEGFNPGQQQQQQGDAPPRTK